MENKENVIINSYNDENVLNNYIESRVDAKSPHNQTIKEKLFDLVGDYSYKTILDLGCGIGVFSKDFSKKAKRVVGIDISERCIDYAKNNNGSDNIDYFTMDINNLNLIKEKFDIVFSDMVFNYIEDYNKLLLNIYELLNDDGIVVFSQVHPISTASLGESSWVQDNGRLRFQLDNYSNVSKRYRKYFEGNFELYHRRFEELISIAIKNNFEIVELLEPYTSEKEYNRPSFLLVKLRKKRKTFKSE